MAVQERVGLRVEEVTTVLVAQQIDSGAGASAGSLVAKYGLEGASYGSVAGPYGSVGVAIVISATCVVESALLFLIAKRRLGLHMLVWRPRALV